MSRIWLYGGAAVLCVAILAGAVFRIYWQIRSPDPRALVEPGLLQFCAEVQGELDSRRYDDLDRTEHDLIGLKDRFLGGGEKLEIFYGALARKDCLAPAPCQWDPIGPDRFRRIQDWLDRNPHNVAAKLAAASAWYEYAWGARGCDRFQDLTFDQWQRFFDRVRVSKSYLSGVDPHADPGYYPLMLSILRDTGGPRAAIDRLYGEGHDAFPSFLGLVFTYAHILDPSWYGKTGDVDWLAESTLNDPGGEIGLAAYSIVAEDAAFLVSYPKLFTDTKLSWPRVKQSFAEREKLYGLSNFDWNMYAYMAMMAVDRPAAQLAYGHFGRNWNPAVWGNSRYFFWQALPWIEGKS